jgi:hypothetical protein
MFAFHGRHLPLDSTFECLLASWPQSRYLLRFLTLHVRKSCAWRVHTYIGVELLSSSLALLPTTPLLPSTGNANVPWLFVQCFVCVFFFLPAVAESDYADVEAVLEDAREESRTAAERMERRRKVIEDRSVMNQKSILDLQATVRRVG